MNIIQKELCCLSVAPAYMIIFNKESDWKDDWTWRTVMPYLRGELSNKGLVFRSKTGLSFFSYAFAWAYEKTFAQIADSKYSDSVAQLAKEAAKKQLELASNQKILYLSETAVRERKRNMSIGSELVTAIKQTAEKNSLRLVLRTLEGSTMSRIAERNSLTRIQFTDNDDPRRVLFAS